MRYTKKLLLAAADALRVLRIVVKLDTVSSHREFVRADVTQDNKISADDALLILKYVVRLTETLT